MKKALYCRVSTQEQVKYGVSVDAQKKALINYCIENNYDYDVYADEGISGSSITKRPALTELLNNIQNYDTLIFTKLDRLSRNVKDAITINELLQKNNVKMIAIQDQYIDTSTANGEFIFNLRYALAQQERKQDSERIKVAFDYKVKVSKEVMSGSKIYGYDIVDKHYVINQEEAFNIRKLYEMYLNTGSINKCAKWWQFNIKNELINTIRDRLFNIKYNGKFLYKNVIYTDYIPQIIDDNTFNRVQELLKINYKSYPNKSNEGKYYIFSGLAYCANCGRRLNGSTYKSGSKAYRCSRKEQDRCINNRYFREQDIEQELFKQLPFLLDKVSIKFKEYYAEEDIKDNTPKIKEKIKRLQDIYINGIIELNDYESKYKELNDELEKEQKKIKPKKKINNDILELKDINYLDMIKSLSDEEKQMLYKSIIARIDIDNNKQIRIELKVD